MGELVDLAGFESGAFDAEEGDGGTRIGDGIEARADGGATLWRLGRVGGADEFERLGGVGESGFDVGAVGGRLDEREFSAAEGGRHVSGEELPKCFEFKEIGGGVGHAEVLGRRKL